MKLHWNSKIKILRTSVLCLWAALIALYGCVAAPPALTPSPSAAPSPSTILSTITVPIIADDFGRDTLDSSRWQATHDGDFGEMAVDVYKGRLRLKANTIGTLDETVKFLGVRSQQKIDLTIPKVISLDIDWNNQANGSYLSSGIYICPVATDDNPGKEADWLALEYFGVPPGENARFQVSRMRSGNLQLPFTEGWPEQQRTGRKITNQHLELIIDNGSYNIRENGIEIFSSAKMDINFSQAYLYLQMSSHSNYPSREVYFDDVMVKELSHK